MSTIIEFEGKTPRIHPTAWIAPTAVIIGDVEIGPDSSVFYGCVLRGDVNAIRIGARTNIQDNSVLHVDRDAPCILGDDVTVGHMALVHGTTVGDGTLVGMKSALLSRSVVLEGFEVPDHTLAAGVPAKIRRDLEPAQYEGFIPHAGRYVDLAKRHAALGTGGA